jgi:hypothetical protein
MWLLAWQVGLVVASAALTLHMAIETVKTARDVQSSWQIVHVEKKAEEPEARPRGKQVRMPPEEPDAKSVVATRP